MLKIEVKVPAESGPAKTFAEFKLWTDVRNPARISAVISAAEIELDGMLRAIGLAWRQTKNLSSTGGHYPC